MASPPHQDSPNSQVQPIHNTTIQVVEQPPTHVPCHAPTNALTHARLSLPVTKIPIQPHLAYTERNYMILQIFNTFLNFSDLFCNISYLLQFGASKKQKWVKKWVKFMWRHLRLALGENHVYFVIILIPVK